jgi:hypothetical protein
LAFDWGAFAGALAGASAALGGVLITQRSERRKAQADRVWKERSDIYLVIYRWANWQRSHYIAVRDDGDERIGTIDKDKAGISIPTEKDLAVLRIYGSSKVWDRLVKARTAGDKVLSAWVGDQQQAAVLAGKDWEDVLIFAAPITDASEDTKAKAGRAVGALEDLQDSILVETRPEQSATGAFKRRWWQFKRWWKELD